MPAEQKAPSSTQPRLVADIGGTNARFAIAEGDVIRDELTLACASYPDPASAVVDYLRRVGRERPEHRPREAALDIAGPINGDRVEMTNHAWQFSAHSLLQSLQLRRLIFLNDFTALALAVPRLSSDGFEQIGGGSAEPNSAIALLGAGTGLGVSGLVPNGSSWIPLQGEGGHATLAAASERQAAVLAWLRRQYEHVSAERLLSGMGLELLYRTLCALDGRTAQVLWAKDITARGLSGEDQTCREVLELFCGWLGMVAGNLALILGAKGGVYIGGGIVPRFGSYFAASPFRAAFESKGRFAAYLAPIPCYVITAQNPALLGCARSFTDPSPRVEVTA
ncbi:MAG: glucokinase [Steroidobacteraceae bacterium]